MKNKTAKMFILSSIVFMLLSQISFAQAPGWVSGSSVVSFGVPPPPKQRQVGCSGTGLCSVGATAGVTTSFYSGVPMAGYYGVNMMFNLATAQQNGFIVPAPVSGSYFYIISNSYTFSGNDGSGVPAGFTIPAGSQAWYFPNWEGQQGISNVIVSAPYTAGNTATHAAVKKPSANDLKQANQKTKDIMMAHMKKKKK